ncbi:MAG TPA: trans-aconitate 2-methyltransferase [Acetobacteraceae bacterium]
MSWSPSQYLKFEDERTRPVRDLVAAIPTRQAVHAVDLGCGPGNSTEILLARYPAAMLTGVDNAADMLAAAGRRLPAQAFEQADIATWQPAGSCDVILANASLHWVPNHDTLLPRLVRALSTGGSLAVQMPDNLTEPSHLAMREVAQSGPWTARLGEAAGDRSEVGTVSWYYALLKPHSARVDIWRTIYHHVLSDIDGIVEWFKGSGLRPYLSRLDETEQAAFLGSYRERIAAAYPVQQDGSVLLPFPRLFMVATR